MMHGDNKIIQIGQVNYMLWLKSILHAEWYVAIFCCTEYCSVRKKHDFTSIMNMWPFSFPKMVDECVLHHLIPNKECFHVFLSVPIFVFPTLIPKIIVLATVYTLKLEQTYIKLHVLRCYHAFSLCIGTYLP